MIVDGLSPLRYLGHAFPPLLSKLTIQKMKMMPGQGSPETTPNHQQGSTVQSRSCSILWYVKKMGKNDKDNENNSTRRIYYLFLASRKVILRDYASRLLWKSRFTRKKVAQHFIFHGENRGRSRVTKIPFTILFKIWEFRPETPYNACPKRRDDPSHPYMTVPPWERNSSVRIYQC